MKPTITKEEYDKICNEWFWEYKDKCQKLKKMIEETPKAPAEPLTLVQMKERKHGQIRAFGKDAARMLPL